MSQPAPARRSRAPWSPRRSADLYRVAAWGEGYFAVAASGRLVARPDPTGEAEIDLLEVVERLRQDGLGTPILLRFPDILAHRIDRLHAAFASARERHGYGGRFLAVYPIKVNQQRTLVEEVFRAGRPHGMGLEVGSKPELLAAMALAAREPERPIVCNGFKDRGYLEAAVLAAKMGHLLIPVVESLGELERILELCRRYGVEPRIGARVKLASPGAGRWRESSGTRSKFGLSAGDLLVLLERLRGLGLERSLELLHCHPGSQVQDIGVLSGTLNELARVFVELTRMGAGLRYLDVGGGVGVDYRGRRAKVEGSMNYTLEEYAATVVRSVAAVCDQAEVPHPTLISESGRALVAHHGVLVFDVPGSSAAGFGAAEPRTGEPVVSARPPKPIRELLRVRRALMAGAVAEGFHAAVEARAEARQLFGLGYLSLELRVQAERCFHEVCVRCRELGGEAELPPEDQRLLAQELVEIYYCNFSLFQSLPDSWAIRQVFPILPIHRLGERPERRAMLADLTCDSDGKIHRFPEKRRIGDALPVHSLEPGRPYYLGAFLVGAYQETLGDLHNLFGETHVAAVRLEGEGGWRIEPAVEGDTAREVLGYAGYDVDALRARIADVRARAVAAGRLTPGEGRALMAFYDLELAGYTYLEPG